MCGLRTTTDRFSERRTAPYLPENRGDNFDAKYLNGNDPWKEENAELLR